jgi:hypothetical protein
VTQPEGQQIPIIWPDLDREPVVAANQFVAQFTPAADGSPGAFLLTVGFAAPPLLLGDQEEQETTLRALGAVSSRTVARIEMHPTRLVELLQLLQRSVEFYNGATGQGGGAR